MCLSPITIPNQTKYVSLRFRDRFLQQVPCGHCAECAQQNSNSWYYRAWYEMDNIAYVDGAYCLFDTLTYSDKYLPHLSDFWTFIGKDDDYPCFDKFHIRNFLQLLRTRLIRAGYSKQSFRYFLSSEYGTSDYYHKNGRLVRAKHRPHYHIMLYVYDNRIDPLYLSSLIAELWKYGRTDGLPYRGARYVMEHNYISNKSLLASKLRTCKYVTKYVQKSCKFDSEISKRLSSVMLKMSLYMHETTGVDSDEWLSSVDAHYEYLRLKRFVCQFHRQSQHFGESALSDIDYNELVKYGCLVMPDSENVRIVVPLCTYYKRKLFYEQINISGRRYWQLNELGIEYYKKRYPDNYNRLFSKYDCINFRYKLGFDCHTLVDYVLNYRGRIIADLDASKLEDRINFIDFFNYSTLSDKKQFGFRGLTRTFHGESQLGYYNDKLLDRIPISSFVARYCYYDELLEKQLDIIYYYMSELNSKKQEAYKLKQHMYQVAKYFR